MASRKKQNPVADLSDLLALLRATYQIHQAAHWQAKGDNYYGDHLLFQRLYEGILPEIDSVAERAVGLGSIQDVDPIVQAEKTMEFVDAIHAANEDVSGDADELAIVSLYAENAVLNLVERLLSGPQSQGTQNLLQGIADKHEGHVYLLKQRLAGK